MRVSGDDGTYGAVKSIFVHGTLSPPDVFAALAYTQHVSLYL